MFAAISLSLGCVYACLFLCHFGLWLNTLCLDFNSFYFSQMPNYVHIKCHQPIQHGHLKAKEVSYGKQYSKMYYSCDYICHCFGRWISISTTLHSSFSFLGILTAISSNWFLNCWLTYPMLFVFCVKKGFMGLVNTLIYCVCYSPSYKSDHN